MKEFTITRITIFIDIVQIMKVLVVVGRNNDFFFNYAFLKILGYLISINISTFDVKLFENEKMRINSIITKLSIINETLSKPDWIKEAIMINKYIWNFFPQIRLGEYYFVIWERLLQENILTFCHVNYPQKTKLSENDEQEARKEIHHLIQNLHNKTFAFEPGNPQDVALTIPNKQIGFNINDIKEAINSKNSNKKKIYVLHAGFYEDGHEKGLISYKDGNYFLPSPVELKGEAGFYVQRECFGDIFVLKDMCDDEILYEFILSELIISSKTATSLLLPKNFLKQKEESEQFNPQGTFSTQFYDNILPICGYSSTRDVIAKGIASILLGYEEEKQEER